MKKNKIILKSFLITVGYFVMANIYFFGGFINPVSESTFRQNFETIFTLPAVIIFGVGFGSGSSLGYFTAIIIFLIIWLIILVLMYTYYSMKNDNQKGKPTTKLQ